MIALRVQMGIVMRNVKMYCICDDENMTKCSCFDRKYFTNNLQSNYLKCLSLFYFEQGQGSNFNNKFQILSSWLIEAAENNTFCFLAWKDPYVVSGTAYARQKVLAPITVPIKFNVTSRQHLLEYICSKCHLLTRITVK